MEVDNIKSMLICLCYDIKKLKLDIFFDFGDIDFLGFEGKGLILVEKYKNIVKEVYGVKILMGKN